MNRSRIPYLMHTWSPTSGCSPVSDGCQSCWAKAYHVRYRGGNFSVKLHPDQLDAPLRLRKPSVIGVSLMGDIAHDDVPDEYIASVFGIMAAAERHRFVVLTKRPERLAALQAGTIGSPIRLECCWQALRSEVEHHPKGDSGPLHTKWSANPAGPWPLPNVWLGVSVEDQATADARIPVLLDTPAAHRFVSLEPQIGAVDLKSWWLRGQTCDVNEHGETTHGPALDLVIQGCESGAKRRPFDVQWARDVKRQCEAASVAYYLKQMPTEIHTTGDIWLRNGKRRKGGIVELPLLDGHRCSAACLPWAQGEGRGGR